MKSPTHLDKCIVCPRCQTRTMRKSIGRSGPEYFDDRCHQYFTIEELVNQWEYDIADFQYGQDKTQLSEIQFDYLVDLHLARPFTKRERLEFFLVDTVSPTFEPEWKSLRERNNDYQEVTLMQLGIPCYALEDNSVDTGATHV